MATKDPKKFEPEPVAPQAPVPAATEPKLVRVTLLNAWEGHAEGEEVEIESIALQGLIASGHISETVWVRVVKPWEHYKIGEILEIPTAHAFDVIDAGEAVAATAEEQKQQETYGRQAVRVRFLRPFEHYKEGEIVDVSSARAQELVAGGEAESFGPEPRDFPAGSVTSAFGVPFATPAARDLAESFRLGAGDFTGRNPGPNGFTEDAVRAIARAKA